MLYYHGTTKRAAEAIQREGLKPHRETAYQLVTTWGDRLREEFGEDQPFIYLSKNKTSAKAYAMFRADYEMAKEGEPITHKYTGVTMYKDSPKYSTEEKPVLMVLDIPEEIAQDFERDWQEHDDAFTCLCAIPSIYIKAVEPVENL